MENILIVKAVSKDDVQSCADIWLAASIAGHDFIPKDFWENNYATMQTAYLPAAEVFFAQQQEQVLGFYAIHSDNLAALFVLPTAWGQGVGSLLMEHAKKTYNRLNLTVYTQNSRAICFYHKHGFIKTNAGICMHTLIPEWSMCWEKCKKIIKKGPRLVYFKH